MSVEARLAEIRPAAMKTCADMGLATETRLEDLLKAQAEAPRFDEATASARVSPADLARLYEMRARHLDWTQETGYLGFFAENPGIRYAYRRRLEVQTSLLAAVPGGSLLEVGCGAGILALLAADRFSSIVATDISPTAVDFARRFAAAIGVRNVRFVVADAEQLPFRDGAFSAVAIGEVIGHVASPARAADELARITHAGGALLLSTPCALSPTRALLRLAAIFGLGPGLPAEQHVDRRVAGVLGSAKESVRPEALLRLKRHYRFREIVALMGATGYRLRRSLGATLDLPPPVLIYRYLPARALGAVRTVESVLNTLGLFGRFFSISTIFRFEKPS
ncbi:MAG: methyltransferase domain-containing protein [Deltaproteobacteria bacterium]|nr:methyltransferase domain-containing protein [Deltaproteobacteria bacterium]